MWLLFKLLLPRVSWSLWNVDAVDDNVAVFVIDVVAVVSECDD